MVGGITSRGSRFVTAWWVDATIALAAAFLDLVSVDIDHRWRWGGHLPNSVIVGYAALGALVLLGRRHRPGLVLVLAWFYGWGRVPMHGLSPVFVPLAAIQAFVARRDLRRPWLVPVAFVPQLLFNLADSDEIHEGQYNSAVFVWLAGVLLLGLAYFLGRAEHSHREQLALASDRLDAVTADALGAERRRLARELHDSLGHAITAMTLQAAGAKAVVQASDPPADPRVGRALEAIEGAGAGAMRELHRLLGVLRTQGGVSTPGEAAPGIADIETLVEGARTGGLVVHTDICVADDVDPSVDYAVYRVVQEALANAMRHDGQGARVLVAVEQDADSRTCVSVRSRAWRAPAHESHDSGGYGLAGLHERVLLIGGTLTAGPDGSVFVTKAVFPLRPRTVDVPDVPDVPDAPDAPGADMAGTGVAGVAARVRSSPGQPSSVLDRHQPTRSAP